MFVTKIKPCMSKNKPLNGESANGSLNQLLFIWWYLSTRITVVTQELIRAPKPRPRPLSRGRGRGAFIRFKPSAGNGLWWWVMITERIEWPFCAVDASFKFLPYQLSMVGSWPTMAITGNGELGFDSGEGAWETATTSKDGSRRANYPILISKGGSDEKYLLYTIKLKWLKSKQF